MKSTRSGIISRTIAGRHSERCETFGKNKYDMDRFLEPGQFLLAYNSQRLWAYFDAFEGASSDMKAWY